jgi:hypothetical protein
MIRDLEIESAIRRIEEPFVDLDSPNGVEENQTMHICLDDLVDVGIPYAVRSARFHRHIDRYDSNERSIICRRFTDGLLQCLAIPLGDLAYNEVALFLINGNSRSVQDRTAYRGIGKVGMGTTLARNIWREIVLFTELENDRQVTRSACKALVGLLKLYYNLNLT